MLAGCHTGTWPVSLEAYQRLPVERYSRVRDTALYAPRSTDPPLRNEYPLTSEPTDDAIGFDDLTRDIAEVPAVEVITTVAVHLMSAAAVKCGLAEGGAADKDLDEARKLITALAGLVTAGAPEISNFHAAPLRDGLKSLQLAFREASLVPDAPGAGPGEKFTGPVYS